jgi:hypothetical protein
MERCGLIDTILTRAELPTVKLTAELTAYKKMGPNEIKIEVKEKFPMRPYRGSRGKAPIILNLGTRWRRVVNFIFRPLYHRERTPDQLNRRLGRPQARVGEKKTLLSLPELEPRTVQSIA